MTSLNITTPNDPNKTSLLESLILNAMIANKANQPSTTLILLTPKNCAFKAKKATRMHD